MSVLYFLASTSLSLVDIGLALSLASLLRLPFSPVLGSLVDRLGAKRVLLAANLLQAGGFVAYVFVDSFTGVVAASAVVQLGQTAFWGSFSPVVAAISEPGERERWFGFLGALRNASFAIGGLVAAAAITVGTSAAYTTVVIVNAASYLVTFALLLSVPDARADPDAATSASGGWLQVLGDRAYLALVATNFTYAIAAMALNVAMPVYFTQLLGLPGWVAGAVFTLNTVMIGLGQGLVVNAMTGATRSNILVVGAGLTLVSYGVLLSASWVPVLAGVVVALVAAVVYTGGELVGGPVLAALATEAAPTALRGRYVSLYQTSWNVSSTVAPVTMTWLLERGASQTWLALGAVAAAGMVGSALLAHVMPLAASPVVDTRPKTVEIEPVAG